jgi:hypothetical protein
MILTGFFVKDEASKLSTPVSSNQTFYYVIKIFLCPFAETNNVEHNKITMSDTESSPPPSPVSSDTETQGSGPDSPRSEAPSPEPAPPAVTKKRKRAAAKTGKKAAAPKKAPRKTAKESKATKAGAKRPKKAATKEPPVEAPKDPEAYKAPRGRPPKSVAKPRASKDPKESKQPRLKKSDIEVPLRFVADEANWKKSCVFFQELLGKMTLSQFKTWNKRCKRAELRRLKHASKRRVNLEKTLAGYKNFLHRADASLFDGLDGAWLMNHGFEGSLSAKAIRSKAEPPTGERDHRYDATILLFNECRRRKIEPLGIVSGKTNDTKYRDEVDADGNVVLNKKGKPKRVIESFQYAFSVPEGEKRVWVGASSRFRTGFADHPLALNRSMEERDPIPDDERLGVGTPMVTIN